MSQTRAVNVEQFSWRYSKYDHDAQLSSFMGLSAISESGSCE